MYCQQEATLLFIVCLNITALEVEKDQRGEGVNGWCGEGCFFGELAHACIRVCISGLVIRKMNMVRVVSIQVESPSRAFSSGFQPVLGGDPDHQL